MSATGRNLAGNERRADDFYATPAWCTEAIWPHLRRTECVLDPCAGAGAILDVAVKHGAATVGIELDGSRQAIACERGHSVRIGDALADRWPFCTAVVTNPPYSLAAFFIDRALSERTEHIDRAFLLRINYLGSQKRAAFHRAHPSDIYVLPRRPSFTGGGTDATEYAWFVWGPGRGNRWFMLDVEAT